MGYTLPTATHTFNVYDKGNRLIGLSGEITLPNFNATTVEMEGSGLLGKINEVILGHYDSQEMKIPFQNIDSDIFRFTDPMEIIDLNLRASQQTLEPETTKAGFRNLRMAVRGRLKNFEPGVLKNAGLMNSSITLELFYILIEIDGETKMELDKLNSVYKVNGKDIMEEMRKYC